MSAALMNVGANAGDLDEDANTGDLAQMALVSTAITVFVDAMDGNYGDGANLTPQLSADLYTIVSASDPAVAMEEYFTSNTIDNPLEGAGITDTDGDGETSINEILTQGGYGGAETLLTLGGLDLASLGM